MATALAEAVRAREALGEQAHEQGAREADDVQVVAVDPLDEAGAEALDRVRAGAALPLARSRRTRRVARRRARGRSRASTSCSTLLPRRASSRQRPETTSCVAPAERVEHRRGLGGVRRLAETRAVADDRRVDAEHRAAAASPATERAFPARARARARAGRRRAGRPPRSRGATTSNGIRSCSRIARRCGEVEASRSGAATLIRSCAPSRSPPPASAGAHSGVGSARSGAARVRRRLELDQVLDLEAVRAQQADPVAVAEVELDPVLVGPLEAVHPEVRRAASSGPGGDLLAPARRACRACR